MRTCLGRLLLALVFSGLALCSLRYVADFWPLAFFHSFQVHIGMVLIAGSLLCIALRPGMASVSSLVLCLAFTTHAFVMLHEFRSAPTPAEESSPRTLRVLSFNILGDNWYNAEALVAAIKGSGADIAIILEARPLSFNLKDLAASYPHRLGCGERTPTCDLMILSKVPFLSARMANLSELRRDRTMFVDIDAGGTRVHVAAVHLTKPYYDDYHSEELGVLSTMLDNNSEPLIVAGDFNSASIAPDMQAFLRLHNLRSGPEEPATWPVRARRFGIAIDHIFAREPLVIRKTERLSENLGSNHYGLIADFVLR